MHSIDWKALNRLLDVVWRYQSVQSTLKADIVERRRIEQAIVDKGEPEAYWTSGKTSELLHELRELTTDAFRDAKIGDSSDLFKDEIGALQKAVESLTSRAHEAEMELEWIDDSDVSAAMVKLIDRMQIVAARNYSEGAEIWSKVMGPQAVADALAPAEMQGKGRAKARLRWLEAQIDAGVVQRKTINREKIQVSLKGINDPDRLKKLTL